ncbi:MAG: hypothetical protein LBH28_01895 [Oscillospiraceae bacterium]|nr:hypothetical protein [Oscillospiraceae bacterium]
MRKKLFSSLIGVILCAVMIAAIIPFSPAAQAETVELTVLNPKAHIETRPITPLAERLDNLRGKNIGIFPYSKDTSGGVNWQQSMQTLLAERLAGLGSNVVTMNAKSAVGWHDPLGATYEAGARALDAMIYGVQN